MKDELFVVVLCGGPADGMSCEISGGEAILVPEFVPDCGPWGGFKDHRYEWEWFCDAKDPPWLCNAVYVSTSEDKPYRPPPISPRTSPTDHLQSRRSREATRLGRGQSSLGDS